MADDQRAPQWGDELAQVTKQEWLATAIATFTMGMLAGWGLFGRPQGLQEVLSVGSLAEWLAAIGTFIVGFGAWKYAKAAHFHTLDRADSEEIADRQRRSSQLATCALQAARCETARRAIAVAGDIQSKKVGVLYTGVMAALSDAQSISWTEVSLAAFDKATRDAVKHAEHAHRAFIKIAAHVASCFEEDSSKPPSDEQKALYDGFKFVGTDLADKAAAVTDLMNAEREKIDDEVKEITQRRERRSKVFRFETYAR